MYLLSFFSLPEAKGRVLFWTLHSLVRCHGHGPLLSPSLLRCQTTGQCSRAGSPGRFEFRGF